MPKVNDWNRQYWRNRSGDNVYNPDDRELPEEVLALYENDNGDVITYELDEYEVEVSPDTPESSDSPEGDSSSPEVETVEDYVVNLNGEIVTDYALSGDKFDGEELEQLRFDTRGRVREAATQLMRQLPPLVADEEDGYSYDALQAWAKVEGVAANQGQEELEAALGLVGDAPPAE